MSIYAMKNPAIKIIQRLYIFVTDWKNNTNSGFRSKYCVLYSYSWTLIELLAFYFEMVRTSRERETPVADLDRWCWGGGGQK